MQPVTVDFSERIPIFDKSNMTIFYIASGQTSIAHTSWDMDDSIIKIVKQTIQMVVKDYLQSKPDLTYDNYANEIPAISEACVKKLTETRFEVQSFNITSITPDEASMAMLRNMENTMKVQQMSPEDLAKKMAEEQMKAMQMMGMPGGTQPAATTPATPAAPAQANYPKFCPNCGTKTVGSKFCGNCGFKLS